MGGYSAYTGTLWGSANTWCEWSWNEGPKGWLLPGRTDTSHRVRPRDAGGGVGRGR